MSNTTGKTAMETLLAFIEGVENTYIREYKSGTKEFKKGVDAILTATTIIKMQIRQLLPTEQAAEQDTDRIAAIAKWAFYKGFKESMVTDANVFTAWREVGGAVIQDAIRIANNQESAPTAPDKEKE